MKLKNLVSALAIAVLVTTSNSHVYASEITMYDGIVFEKADEATSVGKERASWGKGCLYITKYNNNNDTPYAYAETQAYSIMYSLSAQTTLIDSEGYNFGTEKTIVKNSDYTKSATLKSNTKSCEFYGHHEFKKSSSSGYQTCTTTKRIN